MSENPEPPTFTYAVIGGGIAGVSCVEQILEFSGDASILLISASPVVKEATSVMRLTKTLQDFVLVEKSLQSFKDVHQSVHVVHDVVSGFDFEKHLIFTKGGQTFGYKKVCICTGARPKSPLQANPYVLTIRDTESVDDLKDRLGQARKVILLGNGGIATEFVHEVSGLEILWVVKDKCISSHYLDPGAGEFFIQSELNGKNEKDDKDQDKPPAKLMKRHEYTVSDATTTSSSSTHSIPGSALGPDWHRNLELHGLLEKKDLTIMYETELDSSSPKGPLLSPSDLDADADSLIPEAEKEKGWKIFLRLKDKDGAPLVVGADLIISATGVTPNLPSSCAALTLHPSDGGILVDFGMRSVKVPDVFAAGDACYPGWDWAKHWFQLRLWTQARQMGLYAGRSMYLSATGKESEIDLDFCFEIFSHVTRFFGYKVVLLGLFNAQNLSPENLQYLLRTKKGEEYIKVVLEKGKMQGALLIGETGLEETFENLILNQIDVSVYGEDLLNPDIDIEDYFD